MQVRQTTTDEHRSKRKFQPSITSYFAVRDDFEDHQDLRGLDPTTRPRHHATAVAQPQWERLAPVVPGQVQADLLSVGMRVRKSVPEGYKTQKTTALPSMQTTPISRPSLQVRPPQEAVPDASVHQRELLPFCGLHKIGGFAEQPTGTRPTNLFPLPAEAFTQPFCPYASNESNSRPHNPSKRSWQDEDDKPLDTNFFFANPFKGLGAAVDDVPVSPLSETPPPSANSMPQARQFAQPKSRRGMGQRTVSDEDVDMDFENADRIEGRMAVGWGSDFEEADFLAREVDMGGI